MSEMVGMTGGRADESGEPSSATQSTGRWEIGAAWAGLILMIASGLLFFLAAGSSAQVNADASALLTRGNAGAGLIRWASLVDLFGYLMIAPVAFFWRNQLSQKAHIDLYTVCGVAYVLIGALGAVAFAAAGPSLMNEYAAAPAALRPSIVPTFIALYQIVVVGLWQTLEGIPGGVWLLGVGAMRFRDTRRPTALIPAVFGVILLLISTVRVVGF